MKKSLGSVLALYPTPVAIIGVMNQDKPTWMLVGHVGIIGHDKILLSLHKIHYTNKFIRQNNRLSVNIVDENILPQADYVGINSGINVDKSDVFVYTLSENNTPLIDASPLTMDCLVVDNYETDNFDNFVCTIENTFVEESMLDEKNKVDYRRLKPVLFEMPTYSYLRTGDVIERGGILGKNWKKGA